MRDSYERFFSEEYITKEQFFEFGLKETIYSPLDKAEQEWVNLKNKIANDQTVYIRGFGNGAKKTHLFLNLYERLLDNSHIQKDQNNNTNPTKLIRELTGYSKTKHSKYKMIRNYQVSHIFGKTKNVYAFTAPWNIVYMPKILDPFTGHEAKGEMINEYTKLFQKKSYEHFNLLIDDFNNIITKPSFTDKLHQSLHELEKSNVYSNEDIAILKKSVSEEFSPIKVPV